MAVLIDEAAKEIALRRWNLPECLHVPVAAVDEDAISNYIGTISDDKGIRRDPAIHIKTIPASLFHLGVVATICF
jgi:hypothetical protein